MCTPTQGVWQPAGCVSCEPVCVCVSLVRVVIICLASTHTALVSSPSPAVLHLSTYLPVADATRADSVPFDAMKVMLAFQRLKRQTHGAGLCRRGAARHGARDVCVSRIHFCVHAWHQPDGEDATLHVATMPTTTCTGYRYSAAGRLPRLVCASPANNCLFRTVRSPIHQLTLASLESEV